MPYDHLDGRADLLEFAREQPANFWRADPHLRRIVRRWAGAELAAAWADELDRFGAQSAGEIDAAVRENNLTDNLPRPERWGPYGERLEQVAHHPSYHAAGRRIYGSGVMTALGQPGSNLRAGVLAFLSSLNGEAGHNCPLACTAGVIKALRNVGSDLLRERYLPRLLSADYDELAHGAQFLTEIQGGSDVGANSVRAVEGDGEAPWRIHGEKWFCSNVTADVMLLTARPEGAAAGTEGLGLFLVPRRLPDGRLNHFRIRRLKDKLGTRSMASAEVDFDGALAWNVGALEDGFRNMMAHVITTSRVWNALATCGAARRACYVAHGYARRRRAFGPPILDYPMVQETLADMRAETAAMVSGTFRLLYDADRVELGQCGDADGAFLRMAINLNKMRSAQSAHEVVLSAIEVLGGNGTIESFSVLPRLLRDNVVFENWEGTHNVLLMQVLRDCRRLGLHGSFFDRLESGAARQPRLAEAIAEARVELDAALAAEADEASLRMRALGGRLAWLQWATAMIDDGTEPELREHFLERRIGPVHPPDVAYRERIARLSSEP